MLNAFCVGLHASSGVKNNSKKQGVTILFSQVGHLFTIVYLLFL